MRNALGWFRRRGITVRRLLTDNWSGYRSRRLAGMCRTWQLRHRFTRRYTPRTNGKSRALYPNAHTRVGLSTALRELGATHRRPRPVPAPLTTTSVPTRASAGGHRGPEPRPDLEEQRRVYSEFWGEFMKAYPLDDSSQPLQPPTKSTNQFYYLPKEARGWICAVAAQASGQAGVYLNLRRGPIGDRIYAALSEDQGAIGEALGQSAAWVTTERSYYISIWRNFGAQMLTERRAEVQAWLGELVNRFVNTFRPRVEAVLREQ